MAGPQNGMTIRIRLENSAAVNPGPSATAAYLTVNLCEPGLRPSTTVALHESTHGNSPRKLVMVVLMELARLTVRSNRSGSRVVAPEISNDMKPAVNPD